jgi:hypothetical protein
MPSLSVALIPVQFPIKILYTFLTNAMRATCAAYIIILHLINLIVVVSTEKYKLF